MQVDWDFIVGFEGTKLEGYVPDVGQSGVTIASGVDFGGRTAAGIDAWDISSELKARLKPFLGLRGQDAKAVAKTLTVSATEAAAIDNAARSEMLAELEATYNRAISGHDDLLEFIDLSALAQTVIASVAYQYGNLPIRCPKFWKFAIAQDWVAVIGELRDFGDDFPTRRNAEADKLEPLLPDPENCPKAEGSADDGGPAEHLPAGGDIRFSAPGIDIEKSKEAIQKLARIVAEATRVLPEGYRVIVTSAERPGAVVAGTGGRSQHDLGKAIDVQIIGPQGPLKNTGSDPTGLYKKLAIAAFHANQEFFPELDGKLAWGGNFTTGPSNGPRDLMHFDYGGDRGRFGRLADEASGVA